MAEFEINLIRERVLPPAKRKLLFLGITVYLGLSVLVLAIVVSHVLEDCRKLALREIETRKLENEAQEAERPEGSSVAHAELLKDRLVVYENRINAIHRLLVDRPDVARILLGISNHLPYGVYIMNLELDPKRKELRLELMVAGDGGAEIPTAGKLVKAWSADRFLASQIKEIKPLTSQTQTMANRAVSVWEFACELEKRGA
jgi:hypothetical protein